MDLAELPRGGGAVDDNEVPLQIQNQKQDQFDVVELEDDNDGFIGQLSPVTVYEQRIAKAWQALGLKSGSQQNGRCDQACQVAAEDHITTDVATALRLLHDSDEVVVRKALQRLHVKRYHGETEGRQPLLRAAGAPARARNLVSQVV